MPQIEKEEVRQAMLRAARKLLAEAGLSGMTLGDVARAAGTSVGNVYKYFDDKQALFAEAIPESLVAETRAHLRDRIEALGAERDPLSLPAEHPHPSRVKDFLDFSWRHRDELVFLLTRAEGTAHARFSLDLAEQASDLAARYARRAYPHSRLSPLQKRVLLRIYVAFFAEIAATLRHETSRRALEESVSLLSTYHLAGLQTYFRSLCLRDER